jgi:hypothetical protein
MWLEHEIASVYRSLLFEVKSFLRKTLIKEFLEPKINTLELSMFIMLHAPTDLVVALSTLCHLHVLSPRPPL